MNQEILLLEIGSDEIPAQYLPLAIESLGERVKTALSNARFDFDTVRTLGTPRRIAVLVEGLSEVSREATSKVRGPSKKVAYDENNNPTKALSGFCRSLGIDPEAVIIEKENGGEYVYGFKKIPGRSVYEVLPEIIPDVVMGMECPRPVRWGEGLRWYRPIRWVVCLFGDKVVPLTVASKQAGRISYGHRTIAPTPVEIPSAGEYLRVMASVGVVPDLIQRKTIIMERARKLAEDMGGKLLEDEDLLSEVACLCEHPAPFLGRFKEDYLRLPGDVLITVMRHHQRYFPIFDDAGNVMPGFVGVRDGDSEQGMGTVRSGNEWVIRARLDDACFFFDQDTKRSLESRLPELKGVYFLRGAGTMFDKVDRIKKIAQWLGNAIGLSGSSLANLERAAELCKCDLVTFMVREFSELEGIMGGHYAHLEGQHKEVAAAISEHYLPRGPKDRLPAVGVSSALSIADKIDTLAVAFSLGIEPSGSQDPLGLRRSATGIVSTVMHYGYDFPMESLVNQATALARACVKNPDDTAPARLLEFLRGRVEVYLSERGLAVEVVRAVLGGGETRIARLPGMALALDGAVRSGTLGDLVIGWRRTAVLGKSAEERTVDPDLLVEAQEKELYDALRETTPKANELYENQRYSDYLALLASLRPRIDGCLDNVLIMATEPAVRRNRVALLGSVSDLFTRFADFGQVLSLAAR